VTGHELTLIAGPKHSRRNAELIRAWLRNYPAADTNPMIRDWYKRNFLTEEDAKGLIR
jgi:hypothetical protein